MTVELDGPRLEPKSKGEPKQLVIFLHGYGADGNDLIELGHELGKVLPDAAFVSPHAPEPMAGVFGGRQWFPLRTLSEEEIEAGVVKAAPALKAFIEAEAARHNLPLSQVALVGFSQGTMMALEVGLRLNPAPAAIVGFSGHLAGADRLLGDIAAKPPVLLIHGSADEIVPAQATHHARMVLGKAGVPVQWQIRPGLGHGIDQEGLKTAADFLRAAFGLG